MKSRSNAGLIFTVVVAVLVALLSYGYLSSQKATIYIFNKDLPAGSVISDGDVSALEVDKKMVLAAGDGIYITKADKDRVIGSPLRYDVTRGMPLMASLTDEFGGTPAEKRLSPNMVAMTVEVDNVTAGSPDIGNGSRVNVYANYETNSSKVSYLLFQNIAVLDVVVQGSSSGITVQGVTLEVTPAQSVALSYAAQFGKIRLGLIKQGNYQEAPVGAYSGGSVTDEVAPASGR